MTGRAGGDGGPTQAVARNAAAAEFPTRAAAILPVRFASTRLPGKPLLAQTGQPLIRHVWEQVSRARRLDPVIVATDDARIAAAARDFGARVELTDPAHPSGTDRVAEVVRRLGPAVSLVLNVQGDEPEVDPADLDRLVERLAATGEELVTLARPLGADEGAAYRDPNTVKLVMDDAGHALYFSRAPIPHGLDAGGTAGAGAPGAGPFAVGAQGMSPPALGTPALGALASGMPAPGALAPGAFAHLGVYGWRRDALLRFSSAPPSDLERSERLEQLRALALGMRIGVVLTNHASLGIDTPEDYARFVERHARRGRDASSAPGRPGGTS